MESHEEANKLVFDYDFVSYHFLFCTLVCPGLLKIKPNLVYNILSGY